MMPPSSSSMRHSVLPLAIVVFVLLVCFASPSSALTYSFKKGVAFAWTAPTSGGPQTVAAACADLALFNVGWYYNW